MTDEDLQRGERDTRRGIGGRDIGDDGRGEEAFLRPEDFRREMKWARAQPMAVL